MFLICSDTGVVTFERISLAMDNLKFPFEVIGEERVYFLPHLLTCQEIKESIDCNNLSVPIQDLPPKTGDETSVFYKVDSYSPARDELLKSDDKIIPWSNIRLIDPDLTSKLLQNNACLFWWESERIITNGILDLHSYDQEDERGFDIPTEEEFIDEHQLIKINSLRVDSVFYIGSYLFCHLRGTVEYTLNLDQISSLSDEASTRSPLSDYKEYTRDRIEYGHFILQSLGNIKVISGGEQDGFRCHVIANNKYIFSRYNWSSHVDIHNYHVSETEMNLIERLNEHLYSTSNQQNDPDHPEYPGHRSGTAHDVENRIRLVHTDLVKEFDSKFALKTFFDHQDGSYGTSIDLSHLLKYEKPLQLRFSHFDNLTTILNDEARLKIHELAKIVSIYQRHDFIYISESQLTRNCENINFSSSDIRQKDLLSLYQGSI